MSYRDPTPEELQSPLFNQIWNSIKSWDINVPSEYSGYTGATGNHVCAILDAIREYPYGGQVTKRAGRADYPVIGGQLTSPGMLLYCYVYEARWKGLKTAELCPRWHELSDSEREAWNERAAEITNPKASAEDLAHWNKYHRKARP
jgi:hypothetical protein